MSSTIVQPAQRWAVWVGFFATMISAAPVIAQDQSDAAGAELEEVVVTGSRIRSVNIDSAVPITSISADEITATGNLALGDLLNDLPALRNTYSSANSTRFIGTAGVNFLDLRGLGVESTLVLQNGRRHVSASPGSFTVDVNTIPTDLIDRIEIVTGGKSAVYGSDAVAGVVNFVTKTNFEGLLGTVKGGISSEGDRAGYSASLTAGRNFWENRGNVAVSIEYDRSNALGIADRPDQTGSLAGRTQVQLIEDPAGEPGGSDGIADRSLRTGVRSLGLSEGGTFIAALGTSSVLSACATPVGCVNTVPRVYRFQPGGALVEADYGQDLRVQTNRATGNQIGGDGSTLRRYGQLRPFVERYGVNVLSHLDINEAFTPYVEAKYIRYDVLQQSSPTFASGGAQTGTVAAQTAFATLANSTGVPIQLDNPYLSAAAAATIRSVLPAGLPAAQTQTAFRLQRNNIDLGSREETGNRSTTRVLLGLKGDFNDDWRYDVSANLGKYTQDLVSVNNRVQQRFRLATDAARNAAGQIVCRSQLPGVVTPTPPNAADAAVLAAEIAACVPLNLFGEGAPSAAAIAYVNADTRSIQRHEQKVVSGYVGGDLSQLFELPAGPVAFALGGEWREEDGFRDYGDIVALGRTFLTAISSFRPAEKFAVKEVFGEIGVPLLKDKPFFQELSLQGAARYAEYRGRVGSVLSWDAGASWSPIEDVRFRANLATSVRAPTQLDLFATLGQNFNQLSDPCDVNFINNGTATRPANCLAAGIPVGFINLPARASSTAFSAGGNKLLNAEKARSWTIGGVFQPRFAPGLVVSIDYYDITIADQISAPTAQQILDNCYNGASLNNVFCDVIRRDPATKLFSTVGPEFGLVQGGINFASAKARGVDFDVSYRHDVGIGKLSTQLRGTYVLRRDDFPFVSEPNRPDQRLLEVGDPRLQMNLSTTLQRNAWSIGYDVRYISKQAVASVGSGGGIEDIQTIGGRPPQNADFSEAEFISAVVYYNLRLGYDFSDKLNLYGGVENALNKLPPIGLIGNGGVYAADAIFDNVGRYFYAGAKVKF